MGCKFLECIAYNRLQEYRDGLHFLIVDWILRACLILSDTPRPITSQHILPVTSNDNHESANSEQGMLFFLLLKAAPAMNHPSADYINSPRKIWIEIDSQILNALFCVTGFGLAPWRFRDLYYFVRAKHFRDRHAMLKLYKQNKSWFRPPLWATSEPLDTVSGAEIATKDKSAITTETIELPVTFTGERAPPTPLWRLAFPIWMMVLNTLIQAVLSFFMWHYNRINRPVSLSPNKTLLGIEN